jgi:hypothetical protein
MSEFLKPLIDMISEHNGIGEKTKLSFIISKAFNLIQDRSVYYGSDFSIRFSSSKSENFSNTVLSLSNLRKFDENPFIVCVVTSIGNFLYLANTTLLKKISHSSQELRENNIRGSFNGSDIKREFEGILNQPSNFEKLFCIHEAIGFEGNLARLVDATNNIIPTGQKFVVNQEALKLIMKAPKRAFEFATSCDATELKQELDEKVNHFKNEILLAALIENVNVRGRIIEYLIAGRDAGLKKELVHHIRNRDKGLPQFKTDHALGDFARVFDNFRTETDVKTKIMILNSNPKAYNLDKIIEFLSLPKSVFMFYFVGIDPEKIVDTVLVSMFQIKLLANTILLKHWAGRNSRGVSQFDGKAIHDLIMKHETNIDIHASELFLRKIIDL